MRRLRSKVFFPLGILVGSVFLFILLTAGVPKHKKTTKSSVPAAAELGALVRAMSVTEQDARVDVTAHGTVQAHEETALAAEVQGKVIWLSPNMVEGGFFKAGEVLFRIDDREYVLRAKVAESQVASAKKDLAIANANAKLAADEWQVMQSLIEEQDESSGRGEKSPSSLALFQPQLKSAQAALSGALAQLEEAQLQIDRTTVRAPFNCFVKEKLFDLGQYVKIGEHLATVVGTDSVDILIPISFADTTWLQRGLSEDIDEVPQAEISVHMGNKTLYWKGRLVRVLGDVDTKGRMHRAIVEVPRPYFKDEEGEILRETPLSIGMFTKVKIRSGTLKGTIRIPRSAIRENQMVWVVGEDSRLDVVMSKLSAQATIMLMFQMGLMTERSWCLPVFPAL